MYFCTVTKQHGDVWKFYANDLHDFCIAMYDYFSGDTDVFEVKVEKEKK